ncbi:MAG: anthranilate phosphoribosyltransferase [Pyrinomonadaceae bacterium]
MGDSILRDVIELFRSEDSFAPADAASVLDALILELDKSILAELFRAWNEKGIEENEIYYIAKIMRERCVKVVSEHKSFVDIVGTGGSRSKTFNVSTAAAFVVAGAGVAVAKHGNKAATSSSGSADVLSALGIEPVVDAATAERCLNEIGICFMFAPNFHRLSPTLAKVRRGLGFPTIFNCVGPLCNPANAPHQLIGVWSEELVPKMANALARLGTKKSWVVHGKDGLDEISLSGPTLVAEVENGSVRSFEISPSVFGIDTGTLNKFQAATSDESALIIREVLHDKIMQSEAAKIVLMNAAAAIHINGCDDVLASFHLASESISSGNAGKKLEELADAMKPETL